MAKLFSYSFVVLFLCIALFAFAATATDSAGEEHLFDVQQTGQYYCYDAKAPSPAWVLCQDLEHPEVACPTQSREFEIEVLCSMGVPQGTSPMGERFSTCGSTAPANTPIHVKKLIDNAEPKTTLRDLVIPTYTVCQAPHADQDVTYAWQCDGANCPRSAANVQCGRTVTCQKLTAPFTVSLEKVTIVATNVEQSHEMLSTMVWGAEVYSFVDIDECYDDGISLSPLSSQEQSLVTTTTGPTLAVPCVYQSQKTSSTVPSTTNFCQTITSHVWSCKETSYNVDVALSNCAAATPPIPADADTTAMTHTETDAAVDDATCPGTATYAYTCANVGAGDKDSATCASGTDVGYATCPDQSTLITEEFPQRDVGCVATDSQGLTKVFTLGDCVAKNAALPDGITTAADLSPTTALAFTQTRATKCPMANAFYCADNGNAAVLCQDYTPSLAECPLFKTTTTVTCIGTDGTSLAVTECDQHPATNADITQDAATQAATAADGSQSYAVDVDVACQISVGKHYEIECAAPVTGGATATFDVCTKDLICGRALQCMETDVHTALSFANAAALHSGLLYDHAPLDATRQAVAFSACESLAATTDGLVASEVSLFTTTNTNTAETSPCTYQYVCTDSGAAVTTAITCDITTAGTVPDAFCTSIHKHTKYCKEENFGIIQDFLANCGGAADQASVDETGAQVPLGATCEDVATYTYYCAATAPADWTATGIHACSTTHDSDYTACPPYVTELTPHPTREVACVATDASQQGQSYTKQVDLSKCATSTAPFELDTTTNPLSGMTHAQTRSTPCAITPMWYCADATGAAAVLCQDYDAPDVSCGADVTVGSRDHTRQVTITCVNTAGDSVAFSECADSTQTTPTYPTIAQAYQAATSTDTTTTADVEVPCTYDLVTPSDAHAFKCGGADCGAFDGTTTTGLCGRKISCAKVTTTVTQPQRYLTSTDTTATNVGQSTSSTASPVDDVLSACPTPTTATFTALEVAQIMNDAGLTESSVDCDYTKQCGASATDSSAATPTTCDVTQYDYEVATAFCAGKPVMYSFCVDVYGNTVDFVDGTTCDKPTDVANVVTVTTADGKVFKEVGEADLVTRTACETAATYLYKCSSTVLSDDAALSAADTCESTPGAVEVGYAITTACPQDLPTAAASTKTSTRHVTCVGQDADGHVAAVVFENCEHNTDPKNWGPPSDTTLTTSTQTKVEECGYQHFVPLNVAVGSVVPTPTTSYPQAVHTVDELLQLTTHDDACQGGSSGSVYSTAVCLKTIAKLDGTGAAIPGEFETVVADPTLCGWDATTNVQPAQVSFVVTCEERCRSAQLTTAPAENDVVDTADVLACTDAEAWDQSAAAAMTCAAPSAKRKQYQYFTISSSTATSVYYKKQKTRGTILNSAAVEETITLSCALQCTTVDGTTKSCGLTDKEQFIASPGAAGDHCGTTYHAKVECIPTMSNFVGTQPTLTTTPPPSKCEYSTASGPSVAVVPGFITTTADQAIHNAATTASYIVGSTWSPCTYKVQCGATSLDAYNVADCTDNSFTIRKVCPVDISVTSTVIERRVIRCVSTHAFLPTNTNKKFEDIAKCTDRTALQLPNQPAWTPHYNPSAPQPVADTAANLDYQERTNSCNVPMWYPYPVNANVVNTMVSTAAQPEYSSTKYTVKQLLLRKASCPANFDGVAQTRVCLRRFDNGDVQYQAASLCPATTEPYYSINNVKARCGQYCTGPAAPAPHGVGDVIDASIIATLPASPGAITCDTTAWDESAHTTLTCDNTAAVKTQHQYCLFVAQDVDNTHVYAQPQVCGLSQTQPQTQPMTTTCDTTCQDYKNDDKDCAVITNFQDSTHREECWDTFTQKVGCMQHFTGVSGAAGASVELAPSDCNNGAPYHQHLDVAEFTAATAAYSTNYTVHNPACTPAAFMWTYHKATFLAPAGQHVAYQGAVDLINQITFLISSTTPPAPIQWRIADGKCDANNQLIGQRSATCVKESTSASGVKNYVVSNNPTVDCAHVQQEVLEQVLDCTYIPSVDQPDDVTKMVKVQDNLCEHHFTRTFSCSQHFAFGPTPTTVDLSAELRWCVPTPALALTTAESAAWPITSSLRSLTVARDVIFEADHCVMQCRATAPTGGAWASCDTTTFIPTWTETPGSCATAVWETAPFDNNDLITPTRAQVVVHNKAATCTAKCTSCSAYQCDAAVDPTGTMSHVAITPGNTWSHSLAPTSCGAQTCGCTQSIDQQALLDDLAQPTPTHWTADNNAPECGDVITFTLDLSIAQCQGPDGTLYGREQCYTHASILQGTTSFTYSCTKPCLSCGESDCVSSFTHPQHVGLTTPYAPQCDATQADDAACDCIAKCHDVNNDIVPCNTLYEYQPTLSTCDAIHKVIPDESITCHFPPTKNGGVGVILPNGMKDRRCIANNLITTTIAGATTPLSVILQVPAGQCQYSSCWVQDCFATVIDTTLPRPRAMRFDLDQAQCQQHPALANWQCLEHCVDTLSPPIIGNVVHNSYACQRPATEMCKPYAPSTVRTKICIDSLTNKRIACDDVQNIVVINEDDRNASPSCTNACFSKQKYGNDFAAAVAANDFKINCQPQDYREEAVDPCANSAAKDTRTTVCAYMSRSRGIYVDTGRGDCAGFNEVVAQQWKTTECQAICYPKQATPALTTPGSTWTTATIAAEPAEVMAQCSIDIYKPKHATCQYTKYTDVRNAFCGFPTNTPEEFISTTSTTCAAQYIAPQSAFPIDPQCTTVCGAKRRTLIGGALAENVFVDEQVVDFDVIPCQAESFRPGRCGDWTAQQIQDDIRVVGCVVRQQQQDGTTRYVTVMSGDCQLTANDLNKQPMLAQQWKGDATCQHFCSKTTYQHGNVLNMANAQPCAETTLPLQNGCMEQPITRNAYCVYNNNGKWTVDTTTAPGQPCREKTLESTVNFVYPKKTDCVYDWRCNKGPSDSVNFNDFVECNAPIFAPKLCGARCTPAPTAAIARCVTLTPRRDGTVEVVTAAEHCGYPQAPDYECPCQQKCRPSADMPWAQCTDDSTQWREPTACGHYAERQVGLQTIAGTVGTSCANQNTFDCGAFTLPLAQRLPTTQRIAETCGSILEHKCTNSVDNPLKTPTQYTECDQGQGGFPDCSTTTECGFGRGVERQVGCFMDGTELTAYFNQVFPNASDVVNKKHHVDYLKTLCDARATEQLIPRLKQCPCKNDFYCLKQHATIAASTTNEALYTTCGADQPQQFPQCLTTCVGDDRDVSRNVYCRKTNGSFIAITPENKDECATLSAPMPTTTKTCAGTAKCKAKHFCSPPGSLAVVNGVITNHAAMDCALQTTWSAECYKPAVANTWPLPSTCILPGITPATDVFYRRRDTQCLLYIEHTAANNFPAIPTTVALPRGVTSAEYCQQLAGGATATPATAIVDTIANCQVQEGCAEAIDDLTPATTQQVQEGSRLSLSWSYLGPKVTTKRLSLWYAVVYSNPTTTATTSPTLSWVPITTAANGPVMSAKSFVWTLPEQVLSREAGLIADTIYIRAAAAPNVYHYTPQITVQKVETCNTIGTQCTGLLNIGSPACRVTGGVPICQCARPTNGLTVFTKDCERTDVCDAKSLLQCKNGGYLRYSSSSSTADQCETTCTCPGGQTGADCAGACLPAEKCNIAQGAQDPQSCGCTKCWVGFAGAQCNECIKYAMLNITSPNLDIIAAFNALPGSSTATLRVTWVKQLVAYISQQTGHPVEYIQYDDERSGVVLNEKNVQVLVSHIKFIGRCDAAAAFELSAVSAPALNDNISWWRLQQDFENSPAFQSAAGPQSTVQAQYPAAQPEEVVDCAVDKTHPTCPAPSNNAAFDSVSMGSMTAVIIAAVVALFSVVF